MEGIVHNFGNFLEDCVKNDSFKEAGKVIKLVRRNLDDNVADSSLNYTISKLFDEPYNIIKFLIQINEKNTKKEWRDVLVETLELITHMLNNFYNKLRPYTLEIVKICRLISTSNALANDKSKAINIISDILKKDSDISYDDIQNIYESYFKFCGVHQKTTSAKVQRNIFILLGIISNKYPFIINNQNTLIDMYVMQLQNQANCTEKDRDNTLVSGCIDGLSNVLETFPIDTEEIKSKIYNIISKLLLSGSTKFDIRDVVKFTSRHSSMLIENIYNHVPELWFETIKKWALSKGENKHAGYVALETFYDELAKLLQNKNDQRAKNCFQFFFDYFLKTMKDESADLIEVRLAIRGYGSFAIPCKTHMEGQNLSHMFMIIVNRIEQDYFIQENPSIDQLEYLPDYIHCFSTILFQIGEYSFDQIDSLQQISVLMIKTFPKLSPIYHFSVFDSLILCMCYLYEKNPKFLENYLQRVVYQGVLWTCSHRTCFETNNDEKIVTYKSFLILWRAILNFDQSNNAKYNKIHIDVKKSVVQMIYDELIKTLMLLVNKLNLNTKNCEEIFNSEAEKIDDFIIFINVVDFYLELFENINNEQFKKWIKMYTNQIISKSYKYPNVSGFYKLLKLGLNISENLKYFDKNTEDRQILYKKILSFLENVLQSVHEFKDDLQISCLQLLLTIPLPFVSPLLPTMSPIFEMSLTVGFSYLKLAETTVDTLDKWYSVIPTADLKPLLKTVLPNLDTFLRSSAFVGDPDVKIEMKKSKRSKKRKVLIEQDSELTMLQNKILLFVGQLDSETCLYLIEKNINDKQVWENEPFLKFTIPYLEIKPHIYLDKILPRILELSLSCGDQKTRITSCELLHSIVIFMLGTSRQMSQSNQMSKLFERLFLPLVQLGSDSNDIVRQLFNPLVYQMVHWYASPLQLMSRETTILIDVLMEGVSHPNNTSIRDLSSKLIKEFVVWTIKQSSKDDLEKFSQNIHLIISKICVFCFHPNSSKRLGAALSFNSLYTYLREEETMVDKYWIELTYSLLISMSLEPESSKNNIHFENALNHIERVLREKNNLFNINISINRRLPQNLTAPLLKDIVLFILTQTKSTNKSYRRKCIQLFCNISPYVENCGCVKNFVKKWLPDNFFIEYEPYMVDLTCYKNLGTVDEVLKWLKSLLKSLDSYKFLFEFDIVNPKLFIENTKIFNSILYFLKEISTNNLENSVKLFSQYDSDFICLPVELEFFSQLKISVIIALFDFLLSIIDKTTEWCDKVCQNYFYKFVIHCSFAPQIIDIDLDISEKLLEMCNKFSKKLPEKYLNEFKTSLLDYFNEKYNSNINLNTNNIPLSQRNLLKGWLLIQKSSLSVKNSQNFEVIEIIFKNLVKENNKGIKLQITVLEYCELLLQLSFKLNKPSTVLIDSVTNSLEIKHPEMFSKITYGEYFFNTFKEIIVEYILLNHNECIKYLCSKWTFFSDNTALNILILILKYLQMNDHLKKNINVNDFFENVMFGCYPLFKTSLTKYANYQNKNFQIEVLTHITKIDYKNALNLGTKFKFFKPWFIQQLTNNEDMTKQLLQYRSNVLYFIFCFNDNNDSELIACSNNFISKINEQNTLENTDLLVFFKKLLDYLVMSKSQIILDMATKILTKIKYEDENINIQKSLDQYLKSISSDQQYRSIKLIFEYSKTVEEKYKITKTILANLLRFCAYETFEEFYVQNIKEIINNLKENITMDSTTIDIVNKTTNLLLVDMLFSRIKIENFSNKSCKISKTIFPEMTKGNELLKDCMKTVTEILKEKNIFEDTRKEHFRLYYCQAYNSLITIICNAKNPDIDVKGYRLLFFMTKNNKNVWNNIINCEETISVPQDFNKIPSRKKVFINIRNEHQIITDNKIKYIESQSLFNSTLSEDICKFDFTNTIVRSPEFNTTVQTENYQNIMSLKSIDYNNHECMATICGLINHMVDFNISPLPTDPKMAALPNWMDDLKKILTGKGDTNIRIFIARVIHNTQNIFKHYAKYFFDAIMKFILDKCTGENINYFVADLVLMLISWENYLNKTEIKNSATELIKFLMQNSCNDRQDMLKYNLEIIKTCVQIWKTEIEIPYTIIFEKLQHSQFQEKLVAIHLSGIVLANKLSPWQPENINNFITTVVDILNKEKLKKITKPCAELIGMILNFDENIENQLLTKVDVVLKQPNNDKFFHSIEQIQIHYPQIIDKYMRKISMCVFQENDINIKCICLKNVLRRIENECIRFTYKDITDLLNIDDRDVILLTLQIVKHIFLDFKKPHQMLMLKSILEQKSNSNSMIRYAVYEILLCIYVEYNNKTDTESVEIWKLCKPILLSALIDSDIEIQEKIETELYEKFSSLNITEKYDKFLNQLYSADTENFYIGCLNYFMLHSCKETPDYKKLLFEHPLYECKFDEYHLIYNWRLQNSLAPLFSHSIRQPEVPEFIGLRETHSNKLFTPTQSSINLSSSLESSSSFLFTPVVEKKEEIMVHGKMFLNEKTRSLGYAKEATERNIQTEKMRKDRVKIKEKNVMVYRQYRKGDLPDVQIPVSDVLEPLKVLARRDATLSQQLHVMLFTGISSSLNNSKEFIQNFNTSVNNILNQTYMYVPSMIGAFLDTTFEINKNVNMSKIYINNDTLSNVCKNSGFIPIGSLLMEEYINMSDDMPSTTKKGCGSSDDDVKQWVKLADMYKELNEWDAVIGIFSSDFIQSSNITSAIQNEANSNFKDAITEYETLLNTDTNTFRKDFYYDSFFKCFANLSDWQNMSKTVSQLCENNFWDSDFNQEKLLPWYMLSEVCITLEKGQASVMENLNKWMKDKEKADYLKDKFSDYLSVLSLIQQDVVATKHYNKFCFEKFLEDWTHLNPLHTKIRSKKLLNFQKNVDLYKYLHKNQNDFMNYLQQNYDISSDSLPATELRTMYRQLFINNLELKCSNTQDEYLYELKNINMCTLLNLVQNSIDNNNYTVGRKYCRESKKYITSDNKLGNFKLLLAMSKVGYIMAEKYEGESRLNTLTDSWMRLDTLCKKYSNIYPDLHIDSSRHIFKITNNIHEIFSTNSNFNDQKAKIQKHMSSSDDFLQSLHNYGVNRLRSSILQGEKVLQTEENVTVLESLQKTYVTFVLFAQKEEMYKEEIVKYVLKAMKIGSREARQIFPRLLQFELQEEMLEIFKNESSSVPTWMFLLWIPQLLVSLENCTESVDEILERIALTYPQSLIYSYKLTREKYNLNNCNNNFKNIIEKLDNILNNSLIDKFLEEISYMCIPELYFNYYLEKIVKNMSIINGVKEKINDLISDLKYKIQNRENFKSIENSFETLLQNTKEIKNLDDVKKQLIKIYSDNKQNLLTSISRKLKYYSPWLANFKSSDYSTELEIPGQYSGENKPLVKYHAKICNFKHEISCKIKSMRKPFQLTIFGNDSKEYLFLVKFGEDLRQDQKIQQLFTLTNNILKSDKNCRERNLYLEQYQVIPLTKSLGLIQFYENTKPFSDFIFKTVKNVDTLKKYNSIQDDYSKWIKNVAMGQPVSDGDCYAKACITYDKNEVNMMFTRFVNALPADILSKSFWSMSSSPAIYHHLRHQFITSYSSMCIIHWILGIGDRNLGNTLVSLSGRVVGIDFGYAFGAMTQNSIIPELIPFRLTPHLLELNAPLKSIGIVENSMLHVLKAMRNEKELLLTTMDVFIKDPSVDWLEFTKNTQELVGEHFWSPEFKIDIAKRKLNGANCSIITVREIENGVLNIKKVKDAYVNVVKGDEHCKRAKYNTMNLTAEEQIICLIDQATDYNILGRQYEGLQLWI